MHSICLSRINLLCAIKTVLDNERLLAMKFQYNFVTNLLIFAVHK